MMFYQVPSISTIKQEPFLSQLQYQPDCTGTACGVDLGGFCGGPSDVGATFFVPGSDTTPPCTLEHNGVALDCVYLDLATLPCADGSGNVLTLVCTFGGVCDDSQIEVVCDGGSSPCDAGKN